MYGPQTRQNALLLLSGGESLSSVSSSTGISRATLRGWVASDGAYADAVLARAACPAELALPDAQAYAHLLGLYLGDGCISLHPRGVHRLRISCDARYPGLIESCAASMSAVVPSTVGFVAAPGCIVVHSYSRHWPCVFPQHGTGRKHERPILLEQWQREVVEADAGAFVRGLFHSDGCRVTNWTVKQVAGAAKRYEYPRYLFSNKSEDIMALAEWALDLLGVEHRRPRLDSLSVARRASVALLDEVVGPKS
jgi:hypothetical protein